MKILYCNVREMDEYNGFVIVDYHGGGSYTENNVPLEVNNFTRHDNLYYGYVQSTHDTIDIQRNFGASPNADYIDGVLVVWVCHQAKIVGFYIDATVYRKKQPIPDNIAAQRSECEGAGYNITTKQAILIPSEQRKRIVTGMGRCNIWYGNDEINQIVQNYLNDYQKALNELICTVEANSDIKGEEYEPWFTPVLETALGGELPGEIESLLFCLQTGIGVGIVAFVLGRFVERKKWQDKDNNSTSSK